MSSIILKDGSSINRETYQHLCDDISDLQNIPSNRINFGSLAYIISTGKIYIADSNLEWKEVE